MEKINPNFNNELNLVFCNPDWLHYKSQTIHDNFKVIIKSVTDKYFTIHDLRHTAASFLYSKTKDFRAVQKLLGHKNIATTELYIHSYPEDVDEPHNKI